MSDFTFKDDSTFCSVIAHVINSEGGYSNDPRDPGGPTMYGVAWNFNGAYLKLHFGMKEPSDIKALTLDQAKQLYYDRYWLPSGAHGLTDVDLAYIHLDAAINCGTGQAQLFLKRLSKNPKDFDFTDGKNRTLAMSLFLEYTAQRISFYTHCKARDHFLAGWMNRMADVIRNSLNMD
jgi:lysozyme family protein